MVRVTMLRLSLSLSLNQDFYRFAPVSDRFSQSLHTTLCLKKSIPGIFDCNLKTNYQILIIFGTNIPDTTCHQITIQTTTSKISLFYPMRCDCLINLTRKNTFCSHLWHCGWHFIQLSIFQLPAVKLLEVLAHYANTVKEDAFSNHWQQYR